MKTIDFETMTICAAGVTPSRPVMAAASFSASRAAAPAAGLGLVKQADQHLATTRTYIDGWPPGPQERTSG